MSNIYKTYFSLNFTTKFQEGNLFCEARGNLGDPNVASYFRGTRTGDQNFLA